MLLRYMHSPRAAGQEVALAKTHLEQSLLEHYHCACRIAFKDPFYSNPSL
jgi:hypothetical protein